MKTLKIDDKWSVQYDPEDFDRPTGLLRHGEFHPDGTASWNNPIHAIFHALLEARGKLDDIAAGRAMFGLDTKADMEWAMHQACHGFPQTTNSENDPPRTKMVSAREEDDPIPDATVLAADDTFVAQFLNALADRIHVINVEAGWWSDLKTGKSILHTRNVPEMLCLIHSEISEAMEGHRKNLMDDKLTHRPMLQTELADAIIRILDLAGSRAAIERWEAVEHFGEIDTHPIGDIMVEKMEFNAHRADHKVENRLKPGGKTI